MGVDFWHDFCYAALMADTSPDLKAKWQQISKEAAREAADKAAEANEADLLVAYDDAGENEARSIEADRALEDQWNGLKRTAMAEFPEGARILGLTAKNRLVAIAAALGWSQNKIAKASGINQGTVCRWLKDRPDIKLFIDEFNMRAGKSDVVKKKLSALEYKAMQCIETILNDKEASEGMRRLQLDASKWVFNLTRDKTEDGSVGLRTLLESLGRLAAQGPTKLSQEEEAAIFKVEPRKFTKASVN